VLIYLVAILAAILAASCVFAVALKLANPLPSRENIGADLPVPDKPSMLEQAARVLAAGQRGGTGVYLMADGIESFAMRFAMARDAQRTLDVQYYIWNDDLTGRLLIAELIAAADRGVRVRILLDDNPRAGLDSIWRGVTAHPNISVRLFNPLSIRRFRPANFLFDFARLNRRMHNKSFTADNAATMVGGRNIGDEYFGARGEVLFIDVDALAIGEIVAEVTDAFEQYWTSPSAYPADSILPVGEALSMEILREPQHDDRQLAASYMAAANEAVKKLNFDTDSKDFIWAPVRLVIDDPAKALDKAEGIGLMAKQVEPLLRDAKERVDLVSGYFVPTRLGTRLLTGMAKRGVKLRVVTNSIQVTDVPLVHAGYAPYRPSLLAAGVELFEAKPLGETHVAARKLGPTKFSGGGESVHAKSFAIDNRYVFVGSFNLDPRSALLNCEMGFVIDAPELAARFAEVLDERLAQSAYKVVLDGKKSLTWQTTENGELIIYTSEPGTSVASRAMVSLLSLLPIEWLL